jgi:hypothetical protein
MGLEFIPATDAAFVETRHRHAMLLFYPTALRKTTCTTGSIDA